MKLIFTYLFVMALMTWALPGTAWDGVEVVDSTGLMQYEVWGAPSPTPGFCYWELDENSGPEYHATNADGYGSSGCIDPWLAHCDGDSLVYYGTWPAIEGLYLLGTDFRATLSCSVNLVGATRLSAERIIDGNLGIDEHTLTLVYPDGTESVLLAVGTDLDQITIYLEPGVYQVTIEVEASQHGPTGTPVDPYDGRVILKWEDPQVAVSTTSWGSLKTLYR